MGSKVLDVGELHSIKLVFDVLNAETDSNDGRGELSRQLLANLSTSGQGDFSDIEAMSYLIFEVIQCSLFINSQDYDIEAAAAALLSE